MDTPTNIIPDFEETSIETNGNWDSHVANIVKMSFDLALARKFTFPADLRTMPDLTGRKLRYFINNLFKMIPDSKYLELGSHVGATTCSAISGNSCQITAINNHFFNDYVPATFEFNTRIAKKYGNVDLNVINGDFRDIDYILMIKHNVVSLRFTDITRDLYDALMYIQSAVEREYILILHDFNKSECSAEFQRALAMLNHTVVASIGIKTTTTGEYPFIWGEKSDWHNGNYIAVIKKPN